VSFADSPHVVVSIPEVELILQCLSGNPDSSAIRHSAHKPIDWTSFLILCKSHAVRPLVHRTLTYVGKNAVPDHVYSALDQFTRRNARRNAILIMELTRVIAALHDRGIGSATFKGPVLAQHAYGSIALREFSDVDIIVRQRDYPLAERLLSEMGYQTSSLDRHQHEYLAASGQSSFRRPGENWGVDLHWKMVPFGMSFPFSEEEIWSKLQTLPLSGFEMPTLAWDHMALFLAFHGFKERWRSLKWICDFAALTSSRPELDWDDLLARAARKHCSQSLLVAARLSQAVGLSAPEKLLDAACGNSAVDGLTRRTIFRLANPGRTENELSVFIDTAAGLERLQDKVRLAFALLTTLTVSDFHAIHLPRRLRGLYYLIRPFRLAGKAIKLLSRNRTRLWRS
jgi:hypothetical protein